MDPESMETEEQASFERSGGWSVWTWVAIGCGTLVVFAITGIVLFVVLVLKVTGGPVDAANFQLEAIGKGEIRKAYNYGSIDFKNAVSYSRFTKYVESNPSLKRFKSSSFNKRKVENNTASISGTVESKDGAVTPIEYRFVKEKGEWRILFMNLDQPR